MDPTAPCDQHLSPDTVEDSYQPSLAHSDNDEDRKPGHIVRQEWERRWQEFLVEPLRWVQFSYLPCWFHHFCQLICVAHSEQSLRHFDFFLNEKTYEIFGSRKDWLKKNEYICLYIKTARTARFSLFTFSSTFNLRAEPTSPSLPGRTTGSLAGAKELCTQGCSGRRGERILSLDLDSRNRGQNLAAGGKRQKCQIHQVGKHMACNSSSNAFATQCI